MKNTKIFKRMFAVLMVVMMLFASSSVVLVASAASSKKLSGCKFTISSSVAYTGKALKPTVTVKDGKKTLKSGTHYTVSYSSNKNFGTAKAVVTAKKGSGYTGSKTLNFKIVPAKVKSLKATSTASSITLSWKTVTGATKYIVYSYNSTSKKYTKVTEVKTNKATVKKLTAGKTYSYAVMAVAVKNNKTYEGAKSAVLQCATAPKQVTGLKKGTVKADSVVLNWTKVSGATGYKVYKYNSSTKKYTAVETVTTNKATISSLNAATTYKYAVKAYRKVSGTAYYGAYSSILSVKTANPAKVTGLKMTSAVHNAVTLSWTKVAGATGYQVCSYDASTKTYTPITTVTSTKATISSLKTLTTYKYAVRAYSGSTYGSYSDVLSVKTLDKPTYYLNKYHSIFNSGTYSVEFEASSFENIPATVMVKGKKLKLSMAMDGLKADIYCDEAKKEGYMVIPDFLMYAPMSASEMEDMSPAMMTQMFAPPAASPMTVTESVATIGGLKYSCASYNTAGTGTVKYYFLNGTLTEIDIIVTGATEKMKIKKVSSSVSDSDVSLPKLFPLGYVNIDAVM